MYRGKKSFVSHILLYLLLVHAILMYILFIEF